jgi:peptidoglycan lytic transglycosylase A
MLLSGFFAWLGVALLPPSGPGLVLEAHSFDNLAGWRSGTQSGALAAFKMSCTAFKRVPATRQILPSHIGGVAGDWLPACEAALLVASDDPAAARDFFEHNFRIFSLSSGDDQLGLLTGYYEPVVEGSLSESAEYNIPLYIRPPDLVSVNLGVFRPDLAGRRIAGRVVAGRLEPFEDRAAMDRGTMRGQGLELIWLKDAVDAFFLHIQGSGRIRLGDGSLQMVGYADQNGHPYTAIGGTLIRMGALTRQNMSMQAIRRWLRANPDRAAQVMQQNASFIFFRFLDGDAPIGSQGVGLTPGYSLAVDRRALPLGAPIWLEGTRPDAGDPEGPAVRLDRLVVAQDTGGAISGGLRGDVFWGMGEEAEIIAGHMANESLFYLLLPNALAAKVAGAQGNAAPLS